MHEATTEPKKQVTAVITTADGKTYNLGRLDRRFNPRLWYYKFVVYPRLLKKQNKETGK